MIDVYSKKVCPFCVKAKALLDKWGIEYNEIDIELVPEARQVLVDAGLSTVPQIYFKGKLIVEGGYTGLAELSANEIKERTGAIDVTKYSI